MNIVVPLTEFPTLMEADNHIDAYQVWSEVAPVKYAWVYHEEFLSYTHRMELQPSPMEPGKYLSPPNVSTDNPFDVCGELGENEEYYFDKEKNTWAKRKDMFLFPVYSKKSGEKVQNPILENRAQYTNLEPITANSVWSEETQSWELDLEAVRNTMLSSIFNGEVEIRNQPITIDGHEYPGLVDLVSYAEAYNSIVDPEGDTMVVLSNGSLETITKPVLRKIIEACSIKRKSLLLTEAYFKAKINEAITLDGLYSVLELTDLTEGNSFKLDMNNPIDKNCVETMALVLSEAINKPKPQSDYVDPTIQPYVSPSVRLETEEKAKRKSEVSASPEEIPSDVGSEQPSEQGE